MDRDRIVRSSCRMCHGVCQVLVHIRDNRVVKITGDPNSPTSQGYICPKANASIELLYHPDRITTPLRRVGAVYEGRWESIGWDEALEEITGKLDDVRLRYGPEYFGVVQGTGRPYSNFTMRFAHAFGTPNFSAPGHICYFPRVFASQLTVGGFPIGDVYGFGGERPQCVLVWGCNITHTGAADGMCGGMLEKAIQRARQVIVVDPRRTKDAARANYWLQVRPGADGALALAMIHVIIAEGLFDREFVDKHTTGFEELTSHVRPFTPAWASARTDVPEELIRGAARAYATARPAMLQWGNGVDMSVNAFQTARALVILKAITGNLDRPGGDVFWVPPEKVKQRSPILNREVPGDQFVPEHLQKRALDGGRYPFCLGVHPPSFWNSIASGDPYRLKALWIVGANPLLTIPRGDRVQAALSSIDFLVVSDFFMTPTAEFAHIVLPAATWLEQDDVANLHKLWCVLARRKVAQIGESRDDREVLLEVAHRLGLSFAFPWHSYRHYLDWVLEDTGLSFEEFGEKGILAGEMRYFKYREQGFPTPSGKVELFCSALEKMGFSPLPTYEPPPSSYEAQPELAREFPLVLTHTGKIREFFHSEGRQLASLRRAHPDPIVEIHPATAAALGVTDGTWVWVESAGGKAKLRARLFDGIAPSVVAAEHGWWFPEQDSPGHDWRSSNINLVYPEMPCAPETGSEPLRGVLCRIHLNLA